MPKKPSESSAHWANYHSHCRYCDGSNPMEDYIEAAFKAGLIAYGYSSHAPLPYNVPWCMSLRDFSDYIEEAAILKEKWNDKIQVYTGVEVDYVPGIAGPASSLISGAGLDYTIGSVHFVDFFEDGIPWEIDGPHAVYLEGLNSIFRNDYKKAFKRYYELTRQMVKEDCPTVLGHLDKMKIQNKDGIYFDEQEAWYKNAIMETLQCISDAGLIVEINTRGIYQKKTIDPYPSPWIIQEMKKLGIPIMINSDAHHPKDISTNFSDMAELLLHIGYKESMILKDDSWQPVEISTNGLLIPKHVR